MAKITWSKIAKVLKEEYMEGMKCKVCGKEIEEGENALKTLNNIYKHFKENHPDIIEQVKEKLSAKATA
ncbi:MAG: hypothetical protein GXO26_06510 [Crenarchaeota archaeon]|nr:hypothetical protein [Thermoproteota archaeon]NPA70444.1 hypothetical protein [Thermoproteota archaeon]